MNVLSGAKRVAKLDFLLIANYAKYLIWYLVFPFFFFFGTKSLVGGMVTAMCMFSIAAAFTFQSEESENGGELYDFLPVSRLQRVAGRYLSTLAVGAGGFVCSFVLQVLALTVMRVGITGYEYAMAVLLAAGGFLFLTALQIPAYYRYGAVKGRILSLLPMVVVVALCALGFVLLPDGISFVERVGAGGTLGIAGGFLAFGALLFLGSVFVSKGILERKLQGK